MVISASLSCSARSLNADGRRTVNLGGADVPAAAGGATILRVLTAAALRDTPLRCQEVYPSSH